ncbi:hypothetical protein D3C86_1864770 [compost metagenome]
MTVPTEAYCIESEVIDLFEITLELNPNIAVRHRFPAELFFDRIDLVDVDVRITTHPSQRRRFHVGNVSHHMDQQCVLSHVERRTQWSIRRTHDQQTMQVTSWNTEVAGVQHRCGVVAEVHIVVELVHEFPWTE